MTRPGDEADANDALVLVYDAWNRLAESFDDDNADGVPDETESIIREYEYDGQGRMISWTLDGCQPIENYYSDDWQIVETRYDYATNGHSYLQYVWDERYVDAPVVRYQDINMDGDYDDSNDSVLYYTTDANFNVTALVNTQGNMPMERYAYDPYGNVQVLNWDWAADGNNSSDVDNTRLYAGYEYEEYTGLYHVRNRAYHPTLGRWAQRDPIGYADGMNLYEYSHSSPCNGTDPSGSETVISTVRVDYGATYVYRESLDIHDMPRRHFSSTGIANLWGKSLVSLESELEIGTNVIVSGLWAEISDNEGRCRLRNLGERDYSNFTSANARTRYGLWKRWGEDAEDAVLDGKGGMFV